MRLFNLAFYCVIETMYQFYREFYSFYYKMAMEISVENLI